MTKSEVHKEIIFSIEGVESFFEGSNGEV